MPRPTVHRLLLALSCLLTTLLAGVLRAIALAFGHHYSHLIEDVSELPRLTEAFALPVLGGDAARGGDALGFLVWLLLIGAPLVGAVWILRADRDEVAGSRWQRLAGLYVPLALLVGTVAAYGVWAPFLYM